MGRLTRLIGPHSFAVVPIRAGRKMGRHAIAFNFFGTWRFVLDEDSGDLLTWKTEEEAFGNAEAWRRSWDRLKLP